MKLDKIMEDYGFGHFPSGGGCEWYLKETNHKGKAAFVAITDEGGGGVPEKLDEPVLVGVYDNESFDIIEDAKEVSSLKSYLDSIKSTSA